MMTRARSQSRPFWRRAIVAMAAGAFGAGVFGCRSPRADWTLARTDGPVWPPAPETPRVRYLNELRGTADFPTQAGMREGWQRLFFGPRPTVPLVTPHAVAVHPAADLVAVADTNTGNVLIFDLPANRAKVMRCALSESEPAGCPVGLGWLGDWLAVADSKTPRVILVGPDDQRRAIGGDALVRPAGLAVDPQRDRLLVADAGAHAILGFDKQGRLLFRVGTRGGATGEFNFPSQLSVAPNGGLVVADSLNFRIQRLHEDGSPLGSFGRKGDAAGDFALPKGVAVDPDGNVWVVDAHFENVQAFTPEGQLLMVLGGEGSGPGQFWLPAGICIDGRRRMWIADSYNRRVQVFQLFQ